MEELLTNLRWDEQGLIPAVIVDAHTARVLTLCHMNREALEKSLQTGLVHVFRRSRGRLMLKGESSGHIQTIRCLRLDCAGNSLLFEVTQTGAVCHQGYDTCYYREYDPTEDRLRIRAERVFDPATVYPSNE